MITSVSSSQQVYSLDSKRSKQVSFGRKLKQDEQAGYQKAVQTALKELDKQNLSIIAHGPSFPSLSSEDTGIGSPYTSGGVKFMEFLNKLGFNSVQLGPSGKTKSSDASPYTSTVFSDNTLFIDLNALTKPEWAGILTEETFNAIVANNEAKDTGRVSYEYAYDKQDAALQEAWSNFKAKINKLPELSGSDASKISELQEKFDSFKESNKLWLESDARYEALAKANGNDYWGVWNDLDKNLTKMLSSKDKTEQEKAQARLKELETDPKLSDEMEYYKFCQFVMSQQKADIVKKVPVKTIADIQVTYSDRDWWALQNVFMEDQRLGVPPDYFSKDGQAWGFPAIDPDKLFVKDAAGNIKKENGIPVLGEGGQLIKTRFDKMFRDNPGGVRIDHIVGLIDPWVYPATAKTAKVEDGGSRLFSTPDTRSSVVKVINSILNFLPAKVKALVQKAFPSIKDAPSVSKWANVGPSGINMKASADSEGRVKEEAMTPETIDRYAGIIDIIIQSAKDNNVPLSNIICEDLGTLTTPVSSVLKQRGLSGLRVTQFIDPNNKDHMYRGKNVGSKQWIVTGTHDNDTIASWVNGIKEGGQIEPHAKALGEDLKLNAEKLMSDSKEFIKAKYAELFASPAQNVQIMFSDVFGMNDRYNDPGAKGADLSKNWRLRIPNNFEDSYHKQLQEGTAVNLPEVLEIAMNSKDDAFKSKNNALINELSKYAEILKEPEA